MKKKIFSLIMIVMVMGSLMIGCGSGSKSADTGSSKKVLRVAMECAYAPFNWTQEDSKLSNGDKAVPIYGTKYYAYGYDVMMAEKIAKELGYKLEIHKVEWDSLQMSLEAKDFDCIIAGMGRTKEREKVYSFTEPYYYRENCLVVKKGSAYENYTKLSQFKGKDVTVTTQLGTCWVKLLDQIPDCKLGSNYETTAETLMAVSNGTADVCMIDVPTAESAQMSNNDLVILKLDKDDDIVDKSGASNVCISTRKDDKELRDKIQKAMDNIKWSDKDKMDEMMDEAVKIQPQKEGK